VTEVTAMAEVTEKITNEVQEIIENRTKLLNMFLEKNANKTIS